jgi:hypothetical protein
LTQHSEPSTDDQRTANPAPEPTEPRTAEPHPEGDTSRKPPLETDVHGTPDTPV